MKINVTSTKKLAARLSPKQLSPKQQKGFSSTKKLSKPNSDESSRRTKIEVDPGQMIAQGIKTGAIDIMNGTVKSDRSCSPIPPSEDDSADYNLQIKAKEVLPAVVEGGTSHQFLFNEITRQNGPQPLNFSTTGKLQDEKRLRQKPLW